MSESKEIFVPPEMESKEAGFGIRMLMIDWIPSYNSLGS